MGISESVAVDRQASVRAHNNRVSGKRAIEGCRKVCNLSYFQPFVVSMACALPQDEEQCPKPPEISACARLAKLRLRLGVWLLGGPLKLLHLEAAPRATQQHPFAEVTCLRLLHLNHGLQVLPQRTHTGQTTTLTPSTHQLCDPERIRKHEKLIINVHI